MAVLSDRTHMGGDLVSYNSMENIQDEKPITHAQEINNLLAQIDPETINSQENRAIIKKIVLSIIRERTHKTDPEFLNADAIAEKINAQFEFFTFFRSAQLASEWFAQEAAQAQLTLTDEFAVAMIKLYLRLPTINIVVQSPKSYENQPPHMAMLLKEKQREVY